MAAVTASEDKSAALTVNNTAVAEQPRRRALVFLKPLGETPPHQEGGNSNTWLGGLLFNKTEFVYAAYSDSAYSKKKVLKTLWQPSAKHLFTFVEQNMSMPISWQPQMIWFNSESAWKLNLFSQWRWWNGFPLLWIAIKLAEANPIWTLESERSAVIKKHSEMITRGFRCRCLLLGRRSALAALCSLGRVLCISVLTVSPTTILMSLFSQFA